MFFYIDCYNYSGLLICMLFYLLSKFRSSYLSVGHIHNSLYVCVLSVYKGRACLCNLERRGSSVAEFLGNFVEDTVGNGDIFLLNNKVFVSRIKVESKLFVFDFELVV